MPSLTDWLLIGGRAHGITVTTKNKRRVVAFGSLYLAEDYAHNGKTYRIGRCHPTQLQSAETGDLIERLRPREIGHG